MACQLIGEVLPDFGPFALGDAIQVGITHRAVTSERMVADHAIQLGTQPGDGSLRSKVEVVRSPADHARTERIDAMVAEGEDEIAKALNDVAERLETIAKG